MDEVGGDSKLKILSISLRIKSSIRTVEFCQRDLLDDAETGMLYWHSPGGIGGNPL